MATSTVKPSATLARILDEPRRRSKRQLSPANFLCASPNSDSKVARPLVLAMPNGALSSLAGNVDAHHSVAVADLILAQSCVRQTIEELVARHHPDVVGLSVMTFQRRTAQKV